MILVLSGTEDGKQIVKALHKSGRKLITSVATEYGKSIYERLGLGDICVFGRMDEDELVQFMDDNNIELLIDATHPYAANVSLNAINACNRKDARYIRFQRGETVLPESDLIHCVADVNAAVDKCAEIGQRIMLTTGFNNVKDFARLNGDKELIVRILPIANHITKCVELGIAPANIVAMQGPFSTELNTVLYKHFKVDAMVTKESGAEGGVVEKVQTAIDNGINAILIERPNINYPSVCSTLDEVLDHVL